MVCISIAGVVISRGIAEVLKKLFVIISEALCKRGEIVQSAELNSGHLLGFVVIGGLEIIK